MSSPVSTPVLRNNREMRRSGPVNQPQSSSTAPQGTVTQPSRKKPRNGRFVLDPTTAVNRGEAGLEADQS
jgi:hypothetical protein